MKTKLRNRKGKPVVLPNDPDYLQPVPGRGGPYCRAVGPFQYFCTREIDHPGDHAAHGSQDEQHLRWPRSKAQGFTGGAVQ